MKPEDILLYPLMGEKATLIRERTNSLTFIVENKATKEEIKKAVQDMYKVDVLKVNVMNTTDGKKKAHIKLAEKHNADEIASQMGVI